MSAKRNTLSNVSLIIDSLEPNPLVHTYVLSIVYLLLGSRLLTPALICPDSFDYSAKDVVAECLNWCTNKNCHCRIQEFRSSQWFSCMPRGQLPITKTKF
mgnify:FL=1